MPISAVPADLVHAFETRGTPRRLGRGEILMEEGDTSTDVFLVRAGRLQVSRVSLGGREPVFATVGAGRLVGEFAAVDARPRSATVTALEASELLRLPAQSFQDAVRESADSSWWLIKDYAATVRAMTGRAFELATLPVHGRVTAELLRIVERAAGEGQGGEEEGAGVLITDFPTHEQLAARIGTQREAVTRQLRHLAAKNLLEQKRRRLRVPDVEALRGYMDTITGGAPTTY